MKDNEKLTEPPVDFFASLVLFFSTVIESFLKLFNTVIPIIGIGFIVILIIFYLIFKLLGLA